MYKKALKFIFVVTLLMSLSACGQHEETIETETHFDSFNRIPPKTYIPEADPNREDVMGEMKAQQESKQQDESYNPLNDVDKVDDITKVTELFDYIGTEVYTEDDVDIDYIPENLMGEYIFDTNLGAMLAKHIEAFCEQNGLDFSTVEITRDGATEYTVPEYFSYKMLVSDREIYVLCQPTEVCYITFLDDLLNRLGQGNPEQQTSTEEQQTQEQESESTDELEQ